MAEAPQRIEPLDFLRGLASLAVCWFHLTRFQYNVPDQPVYHLVRRTGAYGYRVDPVRQVRRPYTVPTGYSGGSIFLYVIGGRNFPDEIASFGVPGGRCALCDV